VTKQYKISGLAQNYTLPVLKTKTYIL